MSGLGISTVLLTDELILKYSDGRIIRNKGDINLRKDKVYEPVAGGLYDSNYFGSVFLDACNCRAVKKVNVYCQICGSTPLDEETRNSRFARIELPWHYVPYFKMKGLEKVITDNFSVKYDFTEFDEVAGRGKLIKALELGQVEVIVDKDKEKPIIRLHDQFTDINQCSYEGLLKELKAKGFESEANEMKRYIDKNVLVMPASMRGIKISTVGGQRTITLPLPSAVYKSIIMAIEQIGLANTTSLDQEVVLRGILRSYVRKSLMELSEFTKSSKENLARRMFSARVPNTFRSVITAGPELRTDEVSIPLQNAYGILKDRYLDHLMSELSVPFYKANEIYNKGEQKTLDDFEEWVKRTKPVVILVRQPALYKYSMMAFNIKIHKGHDMKMALEVVGPFGGDFDGDSMAGFLVPEHYQEEIMEKMSPVALKFYDKNMKPIISPSHGVMHGYISCSQVDPDAGPKVPKIVDTLEELEEMYNKEEVELQQLVYLNGRLTTFGRAKMESYLGTTINKALGYTDKDELVKISNKNIDDLMKYITLQKDAAEITKNIRIFVLEMSTIEGFSSLSLNQLYPGIPNKFLDELDDIRNNSSLDGIQKFIRVNAIQKEMREWVENNMDQDLRQTMINSNRMKISALLEMTLPQATIDDDGRILSNESSLYQSLNEEEYRAHGLQNRSILDLKQKLVPRSGYLNRQLNFLGQGLEYHSELKDPNNIGIFLPHNRCEGRTTIDGKKVRKSSSDKLIRVKSIAVSDKSYICPEHISSVSFPPDETTEAFGLRVMTTLTEAFTQEGLSLKHSGSFVQVPIQNRLTHTANTKGEAVPDNDKKILYIKDEKGKVVSEYPLPDQFDILHPKVQGKDHYIGTTLATASAGLRLDIMITVMSAKKAMPDEGLSKNVIELSNCFAPVDGKIEYDFVNRTYSIGGEDMGKIIDGAVYYYPQGTKVKKFDRVMSYPLDPQWYFKKGYPIEDVYSMFRKEFRELAGNLTEELLEVLFHLLVNKDFKSGEHTYMGSTRGITKGNNSFFAQLSFERGKSAISKLAAGELKFENDIFTRNILDHMILSAKVPEKAKKRSTK